MINSKYVFPKLLIKMLMMFLCLNRLNEARAECNDEDMWECDNGECISDLQLCNGKVDCADRSDEIAENCMHFFDSCPLFAFRCAYGACVSGSGRCNAIQDCADNSDELICVKKDDSDFQGACSDTEIQCLQSKECINSVLLCDGTKDCKDGSDESVEVCINYGCTSFGFQCSNGGCISRSSKCNNKTECADGSDEAWALCGRPRKKIGSSSVLTTPSPPTPISPTSSFRCQIPDTFHHQNLTFKLHPYNETVEVGSYIEDFDTVHIECKGHYTLKGQPSLVCKNGKWDFDFPTCDGYCDGKLLNRLSIRAICNTPDYKCPDKIRPKSTVQVRCAYGYTNEQKVQDLQCLLNGSFDQMPQRCKPLCGILPDTSTPFSKNGFVVEPSDAPWHVAIYEKAGDYIYNCGGSIVSPTVIISAAHCFWDPAVMIKKNYTEFQIIAGRSSNIYSTEQSLYSQVINVKDIHFPIEYNGRLSGQLDDIAFLKLETPLRYSDTIAPICLTTELRRFAADDVESNKTGYINGYGIENKLERLKMTTLSYRDCHVKSPEGAPVAKDKFCIYNDHGSMVCRGDSGGGFYSKVFDPQTKENWYNLLGVISNTPSTDGQCVRTGDNSYVAVTDINSGPHKFRTKLNFFRKQDEDLF